MARVARVLGVEELIKRYEEKVANVGRYMMYTNICCNAVKIDAFMYFLVKFFVKDRYSSIVDPTCGPANHQFQKIIPILEHWGIEYKPCDLREDNWACRNGYRDCVCDVFRPETLPRGEVFVYDPPFVPTASKEMRHNDYSLDVDRSVSDIKRFFSAKVLESFESRGARMIIAKSSDFYYPPHSDNFYSFHRDILEVLDGWRIKAIIIYRYFSGSTLLSGKRLGESLSKKGIRRALATHSYYTIMERLE